MTNKQREELDNLVRDSLNRAFQIMNAYAEDPYNMGGDARNISSISPHTILAEIYATLAPAQIALNKVKKADPQVSPLTLLEGAIVKARQGKL